MGGYIEKVFTAPAYSGVNDVYGGLLLKQCGYVDTSGYLSSVKMLIERGGIYLEGTAGKDELFIGQNDLRYKNYTADKVIFCSGTQRDGMFDWLPIRAL